MPLLDAIDIQGQDITADALLTRRKLATYLVERKAHYHFTVKGNQPTLQADIALLFQNRQAPDQGPADAGRTRSLAPAPLAGHPGKPGQGHGRRLQRPLRAMR